MTSTTIDHLARSTSLDRNRAVDAYRAIAMLAVALGHWLVIAIGTDSDGGLVARNALEVAPRFSLLTWAFQVMPLFFVVGGFASAMSLDAHWRRNGSDADWIRMRLRRMVMPTAVLAATWLVIVALGTAAGFGGLVAAGAVGAAIPLWFLANYTIDTALAPTMLRMIRANRTRTLTVLAATFVTVEIAHLSGVPWVEHINWVLGWLLFQVGGFLWCDGVLPEGRRLRVIAAGLWVAAIGLVAFGPWPVTMIHVSGVPFSPTHPPSIALVVFGAAFSATAIAAAPAVTRFLERSATAWKLVIAGNSIAMSVYLWHFTAAVASAAVLYAVGALPTSPIGSGVWWAEKTPVIALSLVLLVPIVTVVARFERRALFAAPRSDHTGSGTTVALASTFGLALLVSGSLKVWSLGNIGAVVVGASGVLVAGVLLIRQR
jgi:hypothetical protein